MGERVLIFSLVFLLFAAAAPPAMAALNPNCTGVQTSLTGCLKYAVGEDDKPLPSCCPAARKEDPFCLCDLVRVVFYGEELGPYKLDYYRVVNLSKVCEISGSDVNLCPLVLRLPPGSPDLAAFNGSAPRNGGFSLRPRYSYGVASAVLYAVAHSLFSF